MPHDFVKLGALRVFPDRAFAFPNRWELSRVAHEHDFGVGSCGSLLQDVVQVLVDHTPFINKDCGVGGKVFRGFACDKGFEFA